MVNPMLEGELARITKSVFIPLSDLSLSDREEFRHNAELALWVNAKRLAIRDTPTDLVIRDTLPNTDLGLAAQEDYLIAGAGVVATELAYVQVLLAVDRCIAFYGLGVESAPPSVSRVRFILGTAAAPGAVRGVFQIEQLYSRLEPLGYFSEPIIFTRQENCRIVVMPRLAFAVNTERLHLLARTLEPWGTVISAPSV